MSFKNIARWIVIVASTVAIFGLGRVLIDDPPHYWEDVMEIIGLMCFFILNLYVCITRYEREENEESLFGLWIRTKKQKLRRELKDE